MDRHGRSYRALSLDCADDQDAVRRADQHVAGRAMALWNESRIVKTYPAEPAAARSA